MKPLAAAFTALFVLAAATPAHAQRRVEVGASASTLHVVYGHDTFVNAGPTVTVHFNDRHAVHVGVDLSYRSHLDSAGVNGLYSVQYRRSFRAGSPTRLFLTAGGVGGVGFHHIEGFKYIDTGHYENGVWVPNPNGPTGVGVESRNRFTISPPWVPVVGAGIERSVTPRVSLRGEVTAAVGPFGVMGIMGARASGGVVVRLGKTRNK
jgi:hypothetical protein